MTTASSAAVLELRQNAGAMQDMALGKRLEGFERYGLLSTIDAVSATI
jgi:hypothetical protein